MFGKRSVQVEHPASQRPRSAARLARKLPAAALALGAWALAGCAVTMPYSGEFEELRGKTVLIYFPETEGDLDRVCNELSASPLPVHGCAVIADRPETARTMGFKFREIGAREGSPIECVLLVPPSAGIVQHELGLCATKADGYWNTHRLAPPETAQKEPAATAS